MDLAEKTEQNPEIIERVVKKIIDSFATLILDCHPVEVSYEPMDLLPRPPEGTLQQCDMLVKAVIYTEIDGHKKSVSLHTLIPLSGLEMWNCSDSFFEVHVGDVCDKDDQCKGCRDSSRCECGEHYYLHCSKWTSYNFRLITTCFDKKGDIWYVGDGLKNEVLYKGNRANLPCRAFKIATREFFAGN